jgi:tRNA-modifying protein YgfZ
VREDEAALSAVPPPDPAAGSSTPGLTAGAETETGYRAVREGAALIERTDLRVFRMYGRDPARMLNGLITNDLSAPPPGRGVYGAMLTPKGRIISDLRALVLERGEGREILLLLPAAAARAVAEHLKKFVPPLFARVDDLGERVRVIGVYGPRSPTVVEQITGVQPPEEEDRFAAPAEEGGVVILATRIAGGQPGYDLILPAEDEGALREAAAASGAVPVGADVLETLRIEAGRPRFGLDMNEENLPAEAYQSTGMMERAISFTKGCYTGQEVVVRIAHRGHVNRHLRGLRLGDLSPPAARTTLHDPVTGKEVGWTTSATRSPRLGETIALGYLRREIVPGATVRLASPEGAEATVAELPFG